MDPFELAFDRAFGAGVCSVQFFDFARAAGVMVEAAQGGDAAALRMLDVVGGFLDRVAATRRREAAALCIACPAALTAGVCRQCAEAAGWPDPGWQQRLRALPEGTSHNGENIVSALARRSQSGGAAQ